MIRLTVPCKLEYRDMALRVVAGACRIVRPRRATDVGPAEFDDQVVTAVGEAFTNVVLHGENPEGAVIDLEIDSAVDRLIVRLKDQGKPFDLSTVPVPDLDRAPESGLGVHIMKSWMDEVTYERGRPGANPSPNVLSMTRRLGEFTRTDDGEDTLLRIEGVLDALTVPNIRRTPRGASLLPRCNSHRHARTTPTAASAPPARENQTPRRRIQRCSRSGLTHSCGVSGSTRTMPASSPEKRRA